MTIDFLRTPDDAFNELADYPFTANYVDDLPGYEGLRAHYIDVDPKDSEHTYLCLHGQPAWSYLYRKMIPVFKKSGGRVIAPDFFGFGKSDKPTKESVYDFNFHRDYLKALIEKLDLKNITLVCQDWGSLLGLRLAAENESRFKAIVVGNGMLPTGEEKVPSAFKLWKAFALNSPWFPIGRIVESGCFKTFSKDERRAYDAPFPSKKYKAGTRAFPALVPTTPTNPATKANKAAWQILKQWQKPFVTTFSNGDPITRGGDKYMRKLIPGAHGMKHATLKGGHFLQEDSGTEFAGIINNLLKEL